MATIPKNQLVRIIIILSWFGFLSKQTAQAQCVASGPNSPGTAVSSSYAGSNFPFNNPGNVFASDNNRSIASSLAILLTGQTENLQAINFGFSIPATAVIC